MKPPHNNCRCTACNQWAWDELERLRKVAEKTVGLINALHSKVGVGAAAKWFSTVDRWCDEARAALEELNEKKDIFKDTSNP